MTATLPRAAAMSAWLGAWLRGEAAADDLLAQVGRTARGAPQAVVALPDRQGAVQLGEALGTLRSMGARSASCALPAPGDPVGLGGPAPFNRSALAAGEAVVLDVGLGLVPTEVGSSVEWRCSESRPAPWVELSEAAPALQRTLLSVTERLVDLDVASWQPEIPDALANSRHDPAPALPSSYDDRRRACIGQALLCLEVTRLADEVEPGAISAHEVDRRRAALADLDRAARRALVAACR